MGIATAIGLGAAAVGSALSSKSQKKAADKAADAQLAATKENNALAREIYGKNEGYLSPYVSRGNAAGDAINALLGLGGSSYTSPTAQPAAQAPAQAAAQPEIEYPGYGGKAFNPDDPRNTFFAKARGMTPEQYAAWRQGLDQQAIAAASPVDQVAQTQVQPAVTPQTARSAFDNYLNSTGYQFRLGEGMNALNSGYAGAGTLQSGAAVKDAVRYGQDYASNEFSNYLGHLGNQQGVGLSGASALAGVGQNFVNTISANNQNAADARGNAALIKGQNNPFANALGILGGGLFSLGTR